MTKHRLWTDKSVKPSVADIVLLFGLWVFAIVFAVDDANIILRSIVGTMGVILIVEAVYIASKRKERGVILL